MSVAALRLLFSMKANRTANLIEREMSLRLLDARILPPFASPIPVLAGGQLFHRRSDEAQLLAYASVADRQSWSGDNLTSRDFMRGRVGGGQHAGSRRPLG
jgi:hypothetical protein